MAEFWDVAAGIAIVEGAGGVVRDLSGNIAKPGSGSIIAGSKECVDKIISLVNYN
jgi:fructose-1,6-bisphosphatase/inositol monophosphatase family enzyme